MSSSRTVTVCGTTRKPSSSWTFTVNCTVSAAWYSATDLLSSIALNTCTASFVKSPSCTAATVTGCAVFHVVGVNVRSRSDDPFTLTAPASPLMTDTHTFPDGTWLSRTVYVRLPPSVRVIGPRWLT